ncbi:hypothetical protein, partial [Vibrio sp. HENC-03]|uniref:hypothetical protein n=1 Tax=Vibrio sp. HENC-03 TaxID=992012 RepID=UPI001E58FCDE
MRSDDEAPSHPLLAILGTCLDWRVSLTAQAKISKTALILQESASQRLTTPKAPKPTGTHQDYQHQSFASVEQG